MRRIVVPLDGSEDAESVMFEAHQLMGPGDELLLVHYRGSGGREEHLGAGNRFCLELLAAAMQARGIAARVVESKGTVAADFVAYLNAVQADLVLCSSSYFHGSRFRDLLLRGSVPTVLLPDRPTNASNEIRSPRPLVPLDGSRSAEVALPLGEELASEWGTPLWLIQSITLTGDAAGNEVSIAWEYLKRIAGELRCPARINVVTGRSAATMLVRTVRDWRISDVVMATHGHTASPLHVTGSVAQRVIDHAQCRIIVVPAGSAFGAQREPVGAPV